MSLTPEQERAEREAFHTWAKEQPYYFSSGDGVDSLWTSCAVEGYLARAEIAAAEREQRDKALQHVIAEIAGQLRVGALKDEPFNGKIYWRQIIGVCQKALGLDAILAPREKGGA